MTPGRVKGACLPIDPMGPETVLPSLSQNLQATVRLLAATLGPPRREWIAMHMRVKVASGWVSWYHTTSPSNLLGGRVWGQRVQVLGPLSGAEFLFHSLLSHCETLSRLLNSFDFLFCSLSSSVKWWESWRCC